MRRLLWLGVATIVATPAFAQQKPRTDWWILYTQQAKCVRASSLGVPQLRNPAAAESWERDTGVFERNEVARDDDGKVIAVQVITLKKQTLSYFTTEALCRTYLKAAMDAGEITDPEELK